MVKICNTVYPTENEMKNQEYFKQFSYPLSDFQKYAIESIVKGDHVLTTAPTGSGKTVCALFAIEHFVKQGKRVLYTSPIKALSNQKYYEFVRAFPHLSIGICTGDIKLNPTANVIIMTTEILMNVLFRGNGDSATLPKTAFELDMLSVACVVMDEVHYINDASRGQAWENTLLMLKPEIQLVLLSATIDQPEKFADWIENRHSLSQMPNKKEVWLCSCASRVVPLTHYSFITIGETLYKNLKDDVLKKEIREATNKLVLLKGSQTNAPLNEPNYHKIKKMLDLFQQKQQFPKRKFVVNSLLSFLKEKEMLPAIIFLFSRKQVEQLAEEITTNLLENDSKIPNIVAHECESILREKLPNFREYLELPEYVSLVKLLEKGIGIHHAGMVPILREIVELLISKKYIKVLVCTESFSVGLDCPIKTAVFLSMSKYDGLSGAGNACQTRPLYPAEYMQMAGRAGRRGIDTIGNVIHCNNLFSIPSLIEYRNILCGKPQQLSSQFHVNYSMILSILKEDIGNSTKNGTKTGTSLSTIEEFVDKSMAKRELVSFIKQQQESLESLANTIQQKREHSLNIITTPPSIIESYYSLQSQLTYANHKKKKDIEKEQTKYKDQYPRFEQDCLSYKIVKGLEEELYKETEYTNKLTNQMRNQIEGVLLILEGKGFIERNKEHSTEDFPKPLGQIIRLTSLGESATHFGEIHPLIFSAFYDYLASPNFSAKHIVAFLSCFTDTKVIDECRKSSVLTAELVKPIKQCREFFQILEDEEREWRVDVGTSRTTELNIELVDCMAEWCDATTEQECKNFIQQKIQGELGISVGDFTKAILKIANMSRELGGVAELGGTIEFAHKLSTIEPMILKYITICQSLYI